MADNAWSQSGCRSDVWWWGVPGSGCWYWTARFGQYWVGSDWAAYRDLSPNFECGALGPPVKVGLEFLTEFQAAGQWFQGGALYFKNGAWRRAVGDFGQTAGRLAEEPTEFPEDAEMPPGWDQPAPDRPTPPKADSVAST